MRLGKRTVASGMVSGSVYDCSRDGMCRKVVNWWDDYNFWATDVKSIFIWMVLRRNIVMWRLNLEIIRREPR